MPFGDALMCTGTDYNPLHYTNQPLDSESNLHHFPFRQLSTAQGRWTTTDPIGLAAVNMINPQTWNRYAYVGNVPTAYIDPLGLKMPNPGLDIYDLIAFGWEGGGLQFGANWNLLDLFSGPLVCSNGDCGHLYIPGAADFLFDFLLGAPPDTAANNSTQPTACQQTVLNAVNNQFGTNLNANSILPSSDPGLQPGGQVNVDFGASSGLTPTQFNAIQPGRYAPSGFWGALTGYGPSLHVVASPSGLDPNAPMFANSNVGGAYSVSFTAHIDSAWGNNPIGFILHLFIDVFGSKSRKPCP